ncbi:TIGR02757 family protein [Polyangium sp. y55x31]|uniref:TIGR02757 family protein n=1 Tax=Polyangium sp. y55x31 TaxID=3042688 RepID=UPI0024825534|nr:TIGR02757 family protein [Polyangium sp. y55x31]MDI1476988.1 TIGR02757 family protein [Polyangium sp. y55x31]
MSRGGSSLRGADAELRRALDDVRARCDVEARKAADPVHFVHRYARRDDQEIVAMIASALAFGNVKALCAKIEDALARLGPRVAEIADDPAAVRARLAGFRHRVYRDEDLAGLVIGARAVQRAHGSLGKALTDKLGATGTLREALGAWVREIRERGALGEGAGGRRGAEHILPDPSKGSAVKRILLLVRWMARPADGVDLGLWDVPTSRLIIPVDTHIHKLSQNLGLTARKSADFRAAEEITAALARLDPDDPVKYDFSLCHLGMLQTCPSKRDPEACEGCGVKPVCRHWRRDAKPARRETRRRS